MEILACSGGRLVGESECSEQRSETSFKNDGKPDSLQDAEQVGTDVQVDRLPPDVGEPHGVGGIGAQFILEGFASGGSNHRDMFSDFDADGQNSPCESHDSEDDNSDKSDPILTLQGSDIVLDTAESGLLDNNLEATSQSDMKALGQDESQAVWVKWRGKWQSGIRCARADWPLSTLKAKPTHDRKQYLVIFFPRTRNYSWADVLLVRPINEFPLPIAYKTHKAGTKMVKDLTLARRFIMQKLAVSMLNILEQLCREALAETSRDVMVLKDFAMEAFRCEDYSNLGRMLLKLQNMILQHCLASDWLHESMPSWKQRCHDANSAECIEMLKEELTDSILWDEVNSLSSEAVQVNPGPEWKSWKYEVMKLFSACHPMSPAACSDQLISDDSETLEFQVTRKRPKLEVRRADVHTSGLHPFVHTESNSTFCDGYDVKTSSFESETKRESSIENVPLVGGSPGSVGNKWGDIVVEAGNLEVSKAQDMELTPASIASQKPTELGNRNRQCAAFIAAKGRQCVRYANEGDVYCCVHLATRFITNSAKNEGTPPVDSPMCGGTTVLGTKCKHRALMGSSFCKKHRPHDGKNMSSPVHKLKRKNEENLMCSDSKSPTIFVLSREAETPNCVDSTFDTAKGLDQESSTSGKPEQLQQSLGSDELVQCIGSLPQSGEEPCLEIPKRHSLYCEKHIPSWLKRARNGKSRIVSKEVFIELLKNCKSREQKLHLHHACEVFYRLFKSILSLRNPVPKEVQFQWAIAEASKDVRVGDFLLKLVCYEKDRLKKLWGLEDGLSLQASATNKEFIPVPGPVGVPVQTSNDSDQGNVIKCKICLERFADDETLGKHWMDSHKKECQWLFRGYVCAICLDSFTNKKVLEAHVQERHHVEFVEQCMLLQCIPCGSHFGNPDQLWVHVLSVHPSDLRFSNAAPQHDQNLRQKVVPNKSASVENVNSDDKSVHRRFICKFCGLKFDLLPDLGRHHQAAHMSQNSSGPRLTKKGIQFYVQKLKSGRPTRPRFKKGLSSASYTIRNRTVQNLKTRIQASNSVASAEIAVQSSVPEVGTLGRLADSQCSAIAKILMSEIKGTKPHPSNTEILSIAGSACCKISLQAALEAKYGVLPEKMYLKAAKLCSEHNISIEWHQDGFVCPKGCTASTRSPILSPIEPFPDKLFKAKSSLPLNVMTTEWTMDESHCIIDSRHFSIDLSEKNVVLCDDISFGRESVPIACVVDENLLNAEGPDEQMIQDSFPWETFSYVTKPLLDQSLALEAESLQLRCACTHSTCSSETCDHVYLLNNDYEDAKDIYGKAMHGRFPYDERGRIILEEGYLVYECNQRCRCSRNCQNRILQNGVQVKLEIFKTERKGWAVRTREAILRGTFVCEYIGEVIDENEAEERRIRYSKEGCRYFLEIDACINDMSRLIDGQAPYVIDATNYGNVARFINHSCSPNLVNHQVLVESMDSQLAHIGFYASRDISPWEELTYDFRYKLLPTGEESTCLCGAPNCRGKLCKNPI